MQIAKSNEQAVKFCEEGSELLTQAKFYEALVALNKSLCLAEPGSYVISQAFEKRSEVFFEVRQYEKCLGNIQAAKKHGYPNQKLKEREEKCKKLITEKCQSSNDELRNFIKISLPQNDKIPFLADCLELRESKKYGRFIVTNRNLKPGDVIAIEESHLHFINLNAIFIKCYNCFRSNMLDLCPSAASGK